MDEKYLLATVRYVERNPLVAKLCRHTGEWAWSSATAHLNGIDDDLARVKPMLERISDWASYLMDGKEHGEAMELIERHTRTGRPLGSGPFLQMLEIMTEKSLIPKRRGPKPKDKLK